MDNLENRNAVPLAFNFIRTVDLWGQTLIFLHDEDDDNDDNGDDDHNNDDIDDDDNDESFKDCRSILWRRKTKLFSYFRQKFFNNNKCSKDVAKLVK